MQLPEQIQEENRMLRIVIGIAMHELGRAIEIPRMDIESHELPKAVKFIKNAQTGSYIVSPLYEDKK